MTPLSRLSIGSKLSLLVTLATAVALLVLATLAYRASADTYETEARHSLANASEVMHDTIALYDRLLTENTERLGGSFAALLPDAAVTVDPGQRIMIGDAQTPRLAFGGQTANLDFSLVDRFLESTGAIATLFARDGDDFVRITTSLSNAAGERAIGTRLDHANPAYARILADDSYTGRATLFGRDYMTHYRPLHGSDGSIVGILFVGLEYSQGLLALKERLRQTRIGEDGYYFVVDASQGDTAGSIVAHPAADEGVDASTLAAAADQAAFAALLSAGDGDARLALSGDGDTPAAADVHVVRFAPWQWNLVTVQPRANAEAALSALLLRTAIVSLLALVVLVTLTVLASRKLVSQPLARAVDIADNVAAGRLDNRIDASSQDEAGRLMGALLRMQQDLRARIERDQGAARENLRIRTALDDVTSNVMIADADRTIIYANKPLLRMLASVESDLRRDLPGFEVARVIGSNIDGFHVNPAHQAGLLARLQGTHRAQIRVGGHIMQLVINPVADSDGVRIGYVVEWADRTAEVEVEQELTGIVAAAAAGDLSGRVSTTGKQGFLLQLAQQLNALLDANALSLDEVSRVLTALSDGDLTARMDGDFHGVFAKMRDDANATASQLTGIVSRIQSASGAIGTASAEIAAGNNDLSRRTEQQAANLEETAASMEELTSTVKQNADHARQANQLSIGAANVAAQGGQVVGQVVATMAEIQAASRRIADIISVIDGIAFQTNILALNAAVEAARAGEQGRGFAVVATEVRSLAQRSATAAKEIKSLIEDSTDKVGTGSALAEQAGTTMSELVASVQRVTDIMAEISAASQEQAAGIEQVNQTIVQMDETTQQNAALVEEASAAARAMEEQAAGLASAIAVFRIDAQAAPPAVASVSSGSPSRVASV